MILVCFTWFPVFRARTRETIPKNENGKLQGLFLFWFSSKTVNNTRFVYVFLPFCSV